MRLSIGIIGTRGIPNNYGGFEQLAEKLSERLVKLGNDVTVYNSSSHPHSITNWKGVSISVQKDPESKLGTIGQFVYDYNCIKHSRKQNYDIVLQLGYTSSSIWMFLFKTKVVTNMDGLEWKRAKYNGLTKLYLRWAERLAIKKSTRLISDSIGIQNYLFDNYKINSVYIPYAADIPNDYNIKQLDRYKLKEGSYHLIIARLEPENNIEMISDGFLQSNSDFPLIIIGNVQTKYGRYLTKKYCKKNILFLGGIYNNSVLNVLRRYCCFYFHGHSVGGTNPSLLEAMACEALICSHNNEFNRYVLGNDAFYFNSVEDVVKILNSKMPIQQSLRFKHNNLNKIKEIYNWDSITDQYLKVFLNVNGTQK